MAHIIFYCEACRQHFTLYRGDLISIPFGKLPEAVVRATEHQCTPKEAA
jgi:hypothetical protein